MIKAPSEKTPSDAWLIGGLLLALAGSTVAWLTLDFITVGMFATIAAGAVVIVLVIFFLLRMFLKASSMPDGWAHPVLDEKKARKALGLPEDGFSRDNDPTVRIQKEMREDLIDQYVTDTEKIGPEELVGEFIDMGRLYLKSGRYSEAKSAFRKATEQDPGNSKVYNYLGIACGRLKDFDDAIDAYNKAIALDYDYASAHFNLASVYDQMGDCENAIAQWQRYMSVGKVVGERPDMLDRARSRLRALRDGTDKFKKPKLPSNPASENETD